VDMWTEISISN
jgi:hypothetical protein